MKNIPLPRLLLNLALIIIALIDIAIGIRDILLYSNTATGILVIAMGAVVGIYGIYSLFKNMKFYNEK